MKLNTVSGTDKMDHFENSFLTLLFISPLTLKTITEFLTIPYYLSMFVGEFLKFNNSSLGNLQRWGRWRDGRMILNQRLNFLLPLLLI